MGKQFGGKSDVRPGENSSSLSFRKAELEDAPSIVSLVNSAYRGESSKRGWTTEADLLGGQRTDTDEIARLIRADHSMILLCQMGSEIVASAHMEKTEGGAYLGMVAVRPGLQGGGIGKQLMAAAETIARNDWNAGKISMAVITLRHELIAFYQRHGYARTGQIKAFPTSRNFGIPKVEGLRLEMLEKVLR